MPFLSDLEVKEISDAAEEGRGLWEITKPLIYKSESTGVTYMVEPGFKTDFASVPRIPIAFLLCGDTSHPAAALHDRLYTTPHLTDRATADRLFKEASRSKGVPKWRCFLLWLGVRIGGSSHWD
jgi:hypothetical protein